MKWIIGSALLVLTPQCLGAQDPAVIAADMRLHAAATDTVLLDSVSQGAMFIRDGRIFDAAYDISGDPSASTESRVFAIRALIWAKMPQVHYSYGELVSSCPIKLPGFHATVKAGSVPVPADYGERIDQRISMLVEDSTTAEELRRAATCAAGIPEHPIVNILYDSIGYAPVIGGDDISIIYECGNRFVIRNPYGTPMEVQYEVVGMVESGAITLESNALDSPYSENTLETTATGTVRITQEGVVLDEAENLASPCTS